MKVYIENYGCSASQNDGEIIAGLLKKHSIVKNPEKSDINIINTCVVKTPTENRMRHRIRFLDSLDKPLVVAGCMPKTAKKTIEILSPKASIIGPDSILKIDKVVEKALKEKIVLIKDLRKPKLCLPKIRKNNVIDIVQISTGCLGNCSFCQVKIAKGKLFSYPTDLILKQIKQGLKNGCKEFWLTSQDTGCYGLDSKESLPELLNKVSKIKEKFFVRIGMMNPLHITEEIINSFEPDKIFKFAHMPVQSGSDKVLKKMNRHYIARKFEQIVKKFRKEFPMIAISTDVIVGFPSETKADFRKTIELIKKIKPDIVNISKFGKRPDTEAFKMKELPKEEVKRKAKLLAELVKKIELKNNKKWLGWKGEVLINERGKKNMVGRNFAYKPVVTKGKIGEFKKVKINKVYSTYLSSIN